MSTSLQLDPFQGLRIFEDSITRLMNEPRTGRPWSPAVDILETEDALVLKADLPDVDINDIDVRVVSYGHIPADLHALAADAREILT